MTVILVNKWTSRMGGRAVLAEWKTRLQKTRGNWEEMKREKNTGRKDVQWCGEVVEQNLKWFSVLTGIFQVSLPWAQMKYSKTAVRVIFIKWYDNMFSPRQQNWREAVWLHTISLLVVYCPGLAVFQIFWFWFHFMIVTNEAETANILLTGFPWRKDKETWMLVGNLYP